MTPRLTPSLALAAAVLAAGCVEQRESAPIVYRSGSQAPTGQVATATPPVEARPLDVAPPASATPNATGIVDYGGYSAVVARQGDTVASMAARAGVSASALASYNGLPAGYAPRPGDELILPPAPRTAAGAPAPLAGPAPVATEPLAPAAPAPAAQPTAGSTFDVAEIEQAIGGSQAQPTARPQAPAPAATPAPAPSFEPAPTPAPAATAEPDPRVAAVQPAAQPPATPAPAATAPQPAAPRFANPVDGPIVRPYSRAAGAARNDGVDFGAAAGSPVKAAADGQVALVSESLGGLGTIVLIRHENEILTVYGRVDGVSVKKGDRVSRGQSIGVVAPAADGGNATMHFEVRRGADSVDPSDFLPG